MAAALYSQVESHSSNGASENIVFYEPVENKGKVYPMR